jgi:hypothetical protein
VQQRKKRIAAKSTQRNKPDVRREAEKDENRRENEAKKQVRREAEEEKDHCKTEPKKQARREAEVEEQEGEAVQKPAEEEQPKEIETKQQVRSSRAPSVSATKSNASAMKSSAIGTGSKPKPRRTSTSMPSGSDVPLPDKMDNHFFISHCQSTGGDQANAIYLELERLGFACWYEYCVFRVRCVTPWLSIPLNRFVHLDAVGTTTEHLISPKRE